MSLIRTMLFQREPSLTDRFNVTNDSPKSYLIMTRLFQRNVKKIYIKENYKHVIN